MKVKNKEIKGKIFRDNFNGFPSSIKNYHSGNFELLSKICFGICVFEEYLKTPRNERIYGISSEDYEQSFLEYLENPYKKHVALILKYDGKCFSYTRNRIIKMIRGEGKHGQSEIQDKKREAFHRFLFEDETSPKVSEYLFAITLTWVIYPGLFRTGGNLDSSNAMLEELKFHGEKPRRITTVESIVLNIAFEVLSLMSKGKIIWSGKLILSNELSYFSDMIGQESIDNILNQQDFWHSCMEAYKN